MKKFAVFDVDGTIFRWQLYHELFDAFLLEKLIPEEAATRALGAREDWKRRTASYEAYENALIDAVQPSIVGLSEQRFHEIADRILLEKGHHVYRYTLDLLNRLKKDGYVTIALSASHQELVERFCELHHIDIGVGRQYEIAAGRLTEKSTTIYGRKAEILKDLAREHQLTFDDSYGVGDSGGDIDMLRLVAHPVAFNPDAKLRNEAMKNGWPVVIERKSLAYRLERGPDGTYLLADPNSR